MDDQLQNPNGQPFLCPECESWMQRQALASPPDPIRRALHCPHNQCVVDFVAVGGRLAALHLTWPVSRDRALDLFNDAGAKVRAMTN